MKLLKMKVARLGDISPFLNDYGTLRKIVSNLEKKGYLLRVRNGLYLAVPAEFVGSGYEADRYLVASKAYVKEYAISHHSALELLGVARSHFSEVYISIPRSKSDFEFQEVRYRFIYSRNEFGTMNVLRNGITIRVTDRERTLLDCIRRPKYCGGSEELLKSISGFTTIDFARLQEYLTGYDERSLYQRTGFIMYLLRDELNVPVEFLLFLKGKVGKRCYYLEVNMKPGQGVLDRNWNVIIPASLGEMMKDV